MKNLLPIFAMAFVAACHAGPDTSNADAVPPLEDSVAADVVPADSLVKPGVSAGAFVLGADAAPAFTKMGKPDSGDAAMGKAMAIWKTHGALTSLYTERNMGVDDTARIRMFRTTDPSYRTSGNAGTGAALADLTRSFELKQTAWYRAGADTIRVLTAPEGITFEVNQKMFCTGLIVHAPGADPSASYLPFLPGAVKSGPQQ
ncbi:hypothetical protein [Chitinophaga caseinilytica]|uniref:Lipoprotein n=1 Tax=Chitinophaga caseinilytica TaxID=2267521 RepID=A0ABZ2Z008_9BACT